MLTADQRLALIRVKVERAKKHIHDLDIERIKFLGGRPYAYTIEPNRTTVPFFGKNWRLVRADKVPNIILTCAGDAIQNLRTALDHLAYSLVEVRGFVDLNGIALSGREIRSIYFPVINVATTLEYKTARLGKVKGMSQDAIDAIDAAEPYQGGKGNSLWILDQLNLIDKHRKLVIGGSTFIGASLNLADPKEFFMRPAVRTEPLKAGDIIFGGGSFPTEELNKQLELAFDVAFFEPKIIEGEPILRTLVQMADDVDNLILSFRPLLG